jgi:hypothetical protein
MYTKESPTRGECEKCEMRPRCASHHGERVSSSLIVTPLVDKGVLILAYGQSLGIIL